MLILLLTILAGGFALDLILDILNISHIRPDLPGEVSGRYDLEQYRRSQAYLKEHSRFGLLVSTVGFIALIAVFVLGAFKYLNKLAFAVWDHPVPAALVFFGIAGFIADLAGTPFSYYSIFHIEEKYGFNKTTVRTFFLDKLKAWLLAALIGAPLLGLVVWLYTLLGAWFWIAAWILVSGFSILMSFFYSSLIVPLFNKQSPLENGSLKSAIEELGGRAGFHIDKIFVIDGSKRSTKANAYFTGFGRKKRIVLFDTLIRELAENEILAVLAHEIGHYRKKHVIKGMISGILQTGVILFIFSLVVDNPVLSAALGVPEPNFHIGALVFGVLFSPVSLILGLFLNRISRNHEFEADRFAGNLGMGQCLASALIRLNEKYLGNLTPHPLYVIFHYSHPPLLARLKHLKTDN